MAHISSENMAFRIDGDHKSVKSRTVVQETFFVNIPHFSVKFRVKKHRQEHKKFNSTFKAGKRYQIYLVDIFYRR